MIRKKVLFFFLIFLFLSSVSAQASPDPKSEAFWARVLSKEASTMADGTLLSVQNGVLKSNDAEVVLHGVNLGGWMVLETWLSPFSDPDEQLAYSDILSILTERFGKGKANDLMTLYMDHFITESDFAVIRELGFNCVRIPFWYRNFMTERGEWLTASLNQNPGFLRLDWALEQCRQNGLYAILDMHGAPGGQSSNQSTGTIGQLNLYQSEQAQKTMETLWIAIAKRYQDNPYVAAYDIMNEPQNNTHAGKPPWDSASIKQTNQVYDRMIQAIRKVDTRHIITVEGIWSLNHLPHPKTYGWQNMMYQLHIYDTEPQQIADRVKELLAARKEWGVAVYVGEYNSAEKERLASDLYRRHNISRTKWTYKTVGRDWDNWGLFNKSFEKLDPYTATWEELTDALGTEMQTNSGFVLNHNEYEQIK